MADVNPTGAGQDEGLSYLESFVGLLADTRRSLGDRQAALDAGADALAQQASSATARLQVFQEAVSGLAENFATTSQATTSDLSRLALTCSDLADHLRGPGSDALRASEGRFTAAIEHTQATLEQDATRVAQALAEVEGAVDHGDETTAGVLSDQEDGFSELAGAVAEADAAFSQADFDLQGVLDATSNYVGEALENYLVTVFNGFYDHLQNDLPPYFTDLFQDLTRNLHRALEDYDGQVESIGADMASENDSQSTHTTRALHSGLDERDDDRRHSLDEMRALLDELERSRSAAGRGTEICGGYPPIVPMLAMAREVADRVQEMMDVFNPFGG
jgi:hypothetical protein